MPLPQSCRPTSLCGILKSFTRTVRSRPCCRFIVGARSVTVADLQFMHVHRLTRHQISSGCTGHEGFNQLGSHAYRKSEDATLAVGAILAAKRETEMQVEMLLTSFVVSSF